MIKARWLAFRQSPKTDTFLHKTQTYWQQTKNKLPVPRTTVAWMWTGFIALLFLGWFYFFSVEHNVFGLFGNTPGLDKLQNPRVKAASELYTADGKLLGKFYKENRNPVTFEQISPNVVKALIATEDIRFYEHAGVDARALAAAFRDALQGEGRGASTITQQLAKNLYQIRTEESEGPLYRVPGLRTLIIKTKEWITAINLERTYSKEEIITLYLNTVDFGSNAFGIKTAAKTFFGTTPDSLNTQQAATLVGLLKATTYYSPTLNPEDSKRRRNVVLSQMAKYNFITRTDFDSLKNLPLELNYTEDKFLAGAVTYFQGAMNSYLEKWCENNGYDLYTDGLRIYSTIDSRYQQHAEEALKQKMRELQGKFDKHWAGRNPWVDEREREIPGFIEMVAKRTSMYRRLEEKYKDHPDSVNYYLNQPRKMRIFTYEGSIDTTMTPLDSIRHHKRYLHAGMMTMDPFTGHIKAWVGGIDYNFFHYDHVRQAKRQPGSTFKPFVYTAAIDNGWTPCDQITDYRVTINYEENGEKKSWTPRNADWRYSGANMTLRHALGRSINTVTAQLTQKVGPGTVVEYAHKLGINSPLTPVPSVGLGSSDVSVYEMVSAYSTFVNQGLHTEPTFIARIEDNYGNIIHQFVPEQKRAISPETAWLMLHMLKGGIEEPGGTSQNLWSFDLFGKGNEIASKTGTTSNHSDGWFMAITKDLVTGVWVGGDDRSIRFRTSSLGEGSKTALPIYGTYMERLYQDKELNVEKGPFQKPAFKITKRYNCPTYVPRADTTDAAYKAIRSLSELPVPSIR